MMTIPSSSHAEDNNSSSHTTASSTKKGNNNMIRLPNTVVNNIRGLLSIGLLALGSLYLSMANKAGKSLILPTQVNDMFISDNIVNNNILSTDPNSKITSNDANVDASSSSTHNNQYLKESIKDNNNNNNNNNKYQYYDDIGPLNIIIFYPDDWRHDDLQDAHPVLKTPFFTELAKNGIRFTQNAVTTSICWISRATLFTGQYVSRHTSTYLFRPNFAANLNNWKHTWPYMLQQAGYYVAHIGKWQYRNKDNYLNTLFNYSVFYEGVHWFPWVNRTHIHGTDRCKYDALKFLREHKPTDGTPFAMTVAFYPPKGNADPKEVVPEYMKQYEHAFFPEPYNITYAYDVLPYFLKDNKTEARGRYLYRFGRNDTYQDGMKAYYSMLSHIDDACREIIDEVKKQGLYNRTMIIVSADNGEFHGSHALADKWYPYQESIRVPLIIYDPRMPHHKRGTLDHSITLNIDLAETILGAAGLQPDLVMQGRDIADLYLTDPNNEGVCSADSTDEQCSDKMVDKDNTNNDMIQKKLVYNNYKPWRTEFFYEFPMINGLIPQSSALVRKDWKYSYWKDFKYEQLFHIAYDPMELHNLINHTEYTDILNELRTAYRKRQLEAYIPNIPQTICDPILPAGNDIKKLTRCHCLPNESEDICCCPLTPEEIIEKEKNNSSS